MPRRCYGQAPAGVDLDALRGLLIVIEGPDSSGRSTQTWLMARWLEQQGYAVMRTGLKRSKLVANELERAKMGNVLSPRTMSLFYATDFYDQLENRIVPALRAGAVVLADRYIFTLIARDLVRGAELGWLEDLYAMAIVPDAVFFILTSPASLVERTLASRGVLDYWESGMDIGIARDWYASFLEYQRRMHEQFEELLPRFSIASVDGDRSVLEIHEDLRDRLHGVLVEAAGEL